MIPLDAAPTIAAKAAPHPMDLLPRATTAAKTDVENTGNVSPRVSSTCRKRRDKLRGKHLDSKEHATNAPNGSPRTSKNSSIDTKATSASSGRRSSRDKLRAVVRSARGISSLDSFDPADCSEVASMVESDIQTSSTATSVAESLPPITDHVEDGEDACEGGTTYDDYCEDDVVSLEHQISSIPSSPAKGESPQQRANTNAAGECDIIEELLVPAEVYAAMTDSDLVPDPNAYDDYDETEACLALSSVCSSPRNTEDSIHPCASTGQPEADDLLPEIESRAFVDIRAALAESDRQHPFLDMERQQAWVAYDREDLHHHYCEQHQLKQQVSLFDRTAMIKTLLSEAHRHQSQRLSSEHQSAPDFERRYFVKGWRAVASDVDRTMTMEGPLSAQRKLSCMCIFNPQRTEPPPLDGSDNERLVRMQRQEALLRQMFHNSALFVDRNCVREGVYTPHPFAQTANSVDGDDEEDDEAQQLIAANLERLDLNDDHEYNEDEEDEEELAFAEVLRRSEPPSLISIPLPSYSRNSEQHQQ